jgi:UDP-GlcNAc:undecaprenyl-phosphate/decaprenyl-phosphate GlcNAc-1-phosphate transferase
VHAVDLRYLAAFVGAGLIVLLMTPLVRRLAVRTGAIDEPDERRVHVIATPRLGGVAIVIAFVVMLLLAGQGVGLGQPLEGVVAGALLIAGVGVVDDIIELPPFIKLLGQITAAAVAVSWGARITWLTDPLGGMLHLGWLAIPLTILWIVAVTNAINIIDGLDGLAAGVSAIVALTVLVVAAGRDASGVALLAAILAGATLAFLRFNFHPASIFMGDTGAMFLGYMLAAISVEGTIKETTSIALVVPIVALGLPFFDTGFAIVRRTLSGKRMSEADRGHLHHRLLGLGLGQRQVALTLYAVTAALGVSAVVMSVVSIRIGAAVLAIVTGLFVGSAQSFDLLRMHNRPAPAAQEQGQNISAL